MSNIIVTHPILGRLDTSFTNNYGTYKDNDGWRIYGYWFAADDQSPAVFVDLPVEFDVYVEAI